MKTSPLYYFNAGAKLFGAGVVASRLLLMARCSTQQASAAVPTIKATMAAEGAALHRNHHWAARATSKPAPPQPHQQRLTLKISKFTSHSNHTMSKQSTWRL